MRARQIIEAETPRSFLKKVKAHVIPAGDDYYVALGKPPLNYDTAECCPWRLEQDNRNAQLDGMYGLATDVEDLLVSRKFKGPTPVDLTDEETDRVTYACNAYISPIRQAIKRGQSSGTVAGVAGPRAWQLVYWNGGPIRNIRNIPNNFSVQ